MARYDAIADFYVAMVGDDLSDPVSVALLEAAGDLEGRRVLDLACGHGRLSRELARRGASVVGIDLSEELLARAPETAGIEYQQADVTSPDALAGETFDLVVGHFALSDIDDLDGALATVARLLRPGGAFAFSIVHPCFRGHGEDAPSSWPPGAGYRQEGWWLSTSPRLRGHVGANHRMLSTYLNALLAHGLEVEHAAEPPPTAEWLAGREEVPLYLVLRCRRTP